MLICGGMPSKSPPKFGLIVTSTPPDGSVSIGGSHGPKAPVEGSGVGQLPTVSVALLR